jgi:uncharacterized membrane protein
MFLIISCRPVLTVGWGEFAIILIILLILIGPAILGLYKRYTEFTDWKSNQRKDGDK